MARGRSFWFMNHAVNPLTRLLLRSPLGGRMGCSVALLRVTGARTGRVYLLPVQYVREGDRVWVLPGHPEKKTWWRNLRKPRRVSIRLVGAEYEGTAQAFIGSRGDAEMAHRLERYLARFPAARRTLEASNEAVVVEIQLLRS